MRKMNLPKCDERIEKNVYEKDEFTEVRRKKR